MSNDVNKVSVESAEKSSILELAVKSHQVLVPQNVYIGDTAELRVSFVSENAEKLLKGQSFVELPLSGFTGDLQLQDYQIEKLTLFSNGQNNYTFIITFIPWKTGNIDFPNYLLLEEENVVLKFENVTISSLVQNENVTLQGQAAPFLLPGTVYKVYGLLILLLLVLFVLIRLIVKREAVAQKIKKRKLLKKQKKNKKKIIKVLNKLAKEKEQSDVDFAEKLQNIMRTYFENRFDFPFTKTVSSEIKKKYFVVVDNVSEKKCDAIETVEKIFLRTDVIRYAQNSIGKNITSFIENERQECIDSLKLCIEVFEQQEESEKKIEKNQKENEKKEQNEEGGAEC